MQSKRVRSALLVGTLGTALVVSGCAGGGGGGTDPEGEDGVTTLSPVVLAFHGCETSTSRSTTTGVNQCRCISRDS